MKRLFLLISIIMLELHVPGNFTYQNVSDDEVINYFFNVHPFYTPSGETMTLEQFSKQLQYTRQNLDVNKDGEEEIIFYGSLSHISFFAIYTPDSDQLNEISYFSEPSIYQTDIQVHWKNPYLIVDTLSRFGGSNSRVNDITKRIIRCESQSCDYIEFPYLHESLTWGLHPALDDLHFIETDVNIDKNTIQLTTYGMQTYTELTPSIMCDIDGNQFTFGNYETEHYVIPLQKITYEWKKNNFVKLEDTLKPGYVTSNRYIESIFTRNQLTYLLKHIAGETGTSVEQLNLYYDFFNVPKQKRDKSFYLPCTQVKREYANWFPTNTVSTSTTIDEEEVYFTINSQCEMVAWKLNDVQSVESLDDISVLKRFTLDDCNTESLYFQWMDITESETSELLITSGISNTHLWIFDIIDSFELVEEFTGIPRSEDMLGVSVQVIDDEIHVISGLPFRETGCVEHLDCYTLNNPFRTAKWNRSIQSFELQTDE